MTSVEEYIVQLRSTFCHRISNDPGTKAFQFGQAYTVAPFKYVEVVFTLSLGVFYFQEVYTFWNLFGTALVIVSLSLNVIYKSRKG